MKSLLLPNHLRFSIQKLFFFTFISLMTCLTATAQQGILQQRLQLQLGEVTLGRALAAIEAETGYEFSYSSNLIDADKNVQVSYNNTPLARILQDILGENARGITVDGKQIKIQPSAGKGTVNGTVQTSDGQPAAYVTVGIKGHRSVQADVQGRFTLSDIEAGQQIVTASFVGLQTQRQQVIILSGKTVNIHFILHEDAQTLQEVVVNEKRNRKFGNKESRYVAKLPISYLENPQVYASVSNSLLTEQLTTDLSDGLRNAPGIVRMQGSIGRSGDGAVYYNLRGFPTRISMIDGISGQTNGEIDPANVAQIEVMKGPSATLYGGVLTTFGGLINVVTKKPIDTLGGEISFTGGNYSLQRLAADVYGPVSADHKLTARLNMAYHRRNSFQDVGFRKSTFIAPVLAYQVNKRLRIELAAELYDYEGTNTPIVFLSRTRPFFATTPEELQFNWKQSYTSNDITLKAPASNIRGEINYQLSDRWTSQTHFAYNYRKTNGIYQYQFVRGNESDRLLERNVQLQDADGTTINLQQNFTGDFHLGSLRNRLVVGLDYLSQIDNTNNSPIVKFDTINGAVFNSSYWKLNRISAENTILKSSAIPTINHSSSNIYSVYFSDVLNITDQLLAMVSLRLDRFESRGTFNRVTNMLNTNSKYGQTAWSPKFGVVYQLIPKQISLFANYMNGFSYVPPVSQPLPDISGVFKPQQANQVEGGVKMEWFDQRLTFTGSYYDIYVKNIIRDQSLVRDDQEYTISVQDGNQISRGFETELTASPFNGFNLLAGYSHNYSKLLRADPSVNERRPASAGPKDIVNFWASYMLPEGKWRGVGLGFGGNYVSEYLSVNSTITGTFTFPAYTLLHASAFYDRDRFRIGIKFDNLTNEKYFSGQGVLSPQWPRSCSANLTLKF